MLNYQLRRASGSILILLLGLFVTACVTAQTVDVERSDGSPLVISNFAEHPATAFIFLSTRSTESRQAVEAIQNLNNRNRRRKFIFAASLQSG